jgi:hypothetical protein
MSFAASQANRALLRAITRLSDVTHRIGFGFISYSRCLSLKAIFVMVALGQIFFLLEDLNFPPILKFRPRSCRAISRQN